MTTTATATAAATMTPREQVQSLLDRGFTLVFWEDRDDWKGPRSKGWLEEALAGRNTSDKYSEGMRLGIVHGVPLNPGKLVPPAKLGEIVHDVDIDWAEGVEIAKAMLPGTGLIWGRIKKRVSHCLYTCPDVVPMFAYKDIGKDGQTLIEFRPDVHQSMAPPGFWSKDGKREPLIFVVNKEPAHIESSAKLKQRVCLAAIGMLCARHFGRNGFGHSARLAWAGFLLRAGISAEDLVVMGEAISKHCNNLEVGDVRQVVESTAKNLNVKGKKVQGGPALAKLLGANGKAVVARINEWLGHDQDFIRDKSGAIVKDNQDNIRRAVQLLDITLSHDEFAERLLIQEDDGPAHHLEDGPSDELWLRIDREHHFRPSERFFEKVISSLARENTFHPVRDYLEGLRWDGQPRINTWLVEYGGAVDDTVKSEADDSLSYHEAVSSIPLMAAVKRIYEPGCKYDEMLVIESPRQGTDKSGALRALCPNESWFTDDLPLNLKSQQLIEASLGKWIVEASDLSGKRKTEIEQLKAMMSRQVDGPARMAYAHKPVERPRHFIFVGTTNSEAYLNDPTGARRFWPVKVKRFDVAALRRDRDQLWAEAVARVRAGEPIRMPEALWNIAAKEQEKRREIDPWEDTLRAALLNITPSSDGRRRVSASALWMALGILTDRQDRAGALRISQIMQRLGFTRTTVREEGAPTTGYVGPDSDDALDVKSDDEHEVGKVDKVGTQL